MKTTKVYQAIAALKKTEKKDFIKFLNSPYFNTNQSMLELAELLIELVENQADLPNEMVWNTFVKKRDYDDTRFRKYCSDLLKLLEQYLAQQVYDSSPLKRAANLIQVVASRKMASLYNSSLRVARSLSVKQGIQGIDFLYDLYSIERYHQVILESASRTQKLNVEKIIENLDKFYIAQKLMSYQTAMSQKLIVDQEYDLLFIDEILEHIEKHPYEDTPQISILYLIAKTYKTGETKYFSTLKELVFKHINLFPPSEANKIVRSILNILIDWANEGKSEYLRQLLELYKYAIQQPFFFLEQGFNPWIFKTIVLVALRLKEFEWCRQFIDQYAEKLDKEHRENAVIFNMARMHWYQKNHQEVLSLLNQVEFDDFSYNLSSKAMLLATYYELDEVEALFSFLDSYKVFLKRNTAKIPEKRRENYLNLIKYTMRLSKLRRRDKVKLRELKTEIENKANLGDKRWILEKIEEKL